MGKHVKEEKNKAGYGKEEKNGEEKLERKGGLGKEKKCREDNVAMEERGGEKMS